MVADIDYRKFSNRVCNWREAGFIGIGFAVAVGIVAAILLGIYFGTKCAEGELACNDGTCKPTKSFCNGVADCPIGEDEWKCHPSEFYVSFRTNLTYKAETLGSDGTEAFRETQTMFQNAIKAAIIDASEPTNVTVFRFRGVDANGVNGQDNDLAVDAFITLGPAGLKDEEPVPGSLNRTKIIDKITRELAQYSASFNEPGANVTTGVGVVLQSPENTGCKVKTIYCADHCGYKSYYQHGSTKGCPECVCSEVPN